MKPHIFVHIPKTGGWVLRESKQISTYKHKTAKQIRNAVGAAKFSRLVTFAMTRNPYDRLLSAYFYFYQMDETHMFWRISSDRRTAIDIKRFTTFPDFVNNFSDFKYGNYLHFQNQKQFLVDGKTTIVDYIGRFEEYDKSWKDICRLIDLPHVKLKKINTSNHKPWMSYYNDTMREKVYAMYKEDFKLRGYNK